MLHVVFPKGSEDCLELWIAVSIGNCSCDKHAYSVAYELPDFFECVLWHGVLTECVVDGIGEVIKGVEKCAVEIKEKIIKHKVL